MKNRAKTEIKTPQLQKSSPHLVQHGSTLERITALSGNNKYHQLCTCVDFTFSSFCLCPLRLPRDLLGTAFIRSFLRVSVGPRSDWAILGLLSSFSETFPYLTWTYALCHYHVGRWNSSSPWASKGQQDFWSKLFWDYLYPIYHYYSLYPRQREKQPQSLALLPRCFMVTMVFFRWYSKLFCLCAKHNS